MHILTIKISFRFLHRNCSSCRISIEYIFVILMSTNFTTYNFILKTCLNKVWQPKETIYYKNFTFVQQQCSEDVFTKLKIIIY